AGSVERADLTGANPAIPAVRKALAAAIPTCFQLKPSCTPPAINTPWLRTDPTAAPAARAPAPAVKPAPMIVPKLAPKPTVSTPAVTTVATAMTTTASTLANPPQPAFFGDGGGGGSGTVGLVLPIASPALYGLNVPALLWMLVTLLGTVSTL